MIVKNKGEKNKVAIYRKFTTKKDLYLYPHYDKIENINLK